MQLLKNGKKAYTDNIKEIQQIFSPWRFERGILKGVYQMKFYVCEHCGNLITFVKDAGVPVMCCGQKMTEIVPGVVDAAVEKHLPVVENNGHVVTVSVGSVEHPMLAEHSIQWIVLETEKGSQIRYLQPGEKPVAQFGLAGDDKAVAAYEYCNLHGLWKTAL